MTAARSKTVMVDAGPKTAGFVLRRPRLEDRLDEAFGKRLTLVIAGAGYGKSTLVADWARDLSVVWHTVTSPDRDLAFFAHGLAVSFDRVRLGTPEDLLAPLGSGAPAADELSRAEGLAALLCDLLSSSLPHDVMLVLDDLHELEGAAASTRLVEAVCRQAPDRLHVVLLSRLEPPFPVARLRGRGDVLEIGASELALTETEIRALVDRQIGDADAGISEEIHRTTAGWPALTRLMLESLQRVPAERRSQVLERTQDSAGSVFSYLAEEVFGREDDDVIELLRRTAVFDRFTVHLCEAIGLRGAPATLARLSERGLLVHSDGDDAAYAVHALVREFVRERWPMTQGELDDLHLAAAHWFEGRGDSRAAIAHATSASATQELVRLLKEHGERVLERGSTAEIIAAGELIPADARDPALELLVGDAYVLLGDWSAAQACYVRLAQEESPLSPGLAWRLGRIHWDRCEYDEALTQYERACLEQGALTERALLLSWWAWALWHSGAAEDARKMGARALDAACGTDSPRALAAAHCAVMLSMLGHDDEAFREHYGLGLRAAEEAGDVLLSIRLRLNRAGPMQPRPAIEVVETAIQLAELSGAEFYLALALLSRGLKRGAMGVLDGAVADLEQAREVFERHRSPRVIRAAGLLGGIYRERGDLGLARHTLEHILPVAERHRDVQDIAGICANLARVIAHDDPDGAERLVERGLAARRSISYAISWDLLSAGWVALARGDRSGAESYAAEARSSLGSEELHVLPEALELEALSAPDPCLETAKLEEAASLWAEIGNDLARTRVEFALGRLAGPSGRTRERRAEKNLRAYGVRLESQAAGILAALPPEQAPDVEIRTLGGFRVLLEGTPVVASAWQSKKARDLLKLLVARRGRPVTRESVMETLWPGESPADVSNRLSVALSTLRSVLDPARRLSADRFVRADAASISLDLANVVVDVEIFLAAVTAGLAGKRGELEEAEALYSGDFLEEDAYEDWAVPLREEVRGLYIRVARALAEAALERGEPEAAGRYLRRILERDQFDERAHLQLVTCLGTAGQHGDARRAYRAYTARMEQIGVEPMSFDFSVTDADRP